MTRNPVILFFSAILTVCTIGLYTLVSADTGGSYRIKCNDLSGRLSFLGISDDGSSSFWLSGYSGGGEDTEAFRLEPSRQSSWSDSFTLPISGTRSSISPVVSEVNGGTHKLLATNYGNNCVIDTQNQRLPDPPDPTEPPIDPEPPDPTDPPIDPVPPDPTDPTDPPDPPVTPTQPPETLVPDNQPSGDRVLKDIIGTFTQGLTAAALERGYNISDRIVTGLVGRSYLDMMSIADSPATFPQDMQEIQPEETGESKAQEAKDMTSTTMATSPDDTTAISDPLQTDTPSEHAYTFWAETQYFDINDNRYNIDVSGTIAEIRFGLDRMVSDNLLIGIAGGVEKLESDGYGGTISVEQTGVFIGPYIGYRFGEMSVFDIWAGYTFGEGESRISLLEGDFDADRVFVTANLTSQFSTENKINFRPKLSFYYGKTKVENYSLYLDPEKYNGIGGRLSVDDFDANYGVLELSSEVNHMFKSSENTYTLPFFRLGISYAFERPNDGMLITPELTEEETSEVLGNCHIGVRMLMYKKFAIEVRAGYYGIGESDFDVLDGRLVLTYVF